MSRSYRKFVKLGNKFKIPRINNKMEQYAKDILRKTISGYDTVSVKASSCVSKKE